MELKWTPIAELYPEPFTDVLVSYDNREVEIINQWWAGGEPLKYQCWEGDDKLAVAWMPIPPAYKPPEE